MADKLSNTLSDHIATLLATERYNLNTQTINANSLGTYTKDVTKTGYTAIMATVKSSNYGGVTLVGCFVENETATLLLQNGNNTSAQCTPTIDVLYKKL